MGKTEVERQQASSFTGNGFRYESRIGNETPQAPGASSDPSPEGGHEIPVAMPSYGDLNTLWPGSLPVSRDGGGKITMRSDL